MAGNHLTTEQVERTQRFALAPEEFLEVYAHLDECAACRNRVEVSERASVRVADLSARLLVEALKGPQHPPNARISAFVDGTLSPIDEQSVEEHLAICDACRETIRAVETLRSLLTVEFEEAIEPLPDSAPTLLATFQDTSGPVTLAENDVRLAAVPRLPTSVVKQLRQLITDGIATPTRSLRGLLTQLNEATALTPAVALRGSGRDPMGASAQPAPISPSNTVVRSSRPSLRWQDVPDAREYIVTLSHQISADDRALIWKQGVSGQTEAALPEATHLEADQLYIWQVEATLPGTVMRSLPAWFSVLSPQALAKLEPLERTHSDSALILAGLYETYGLYEEAGQQLDRLQSLNPNSELLRTLKERLERERTPEATNT